MAEDSQTPAWESIEQEEGWEKVELADIVGDITSPESIARVLRRKGFQELSNGKWHDSETRRVIEYNAPQPEEKKDEENENHFRELVNNIAEKKSFNNNL